MEEQRARVTDGLSDPCVFCRIRDREAPADWVDEDDLTFSILDIHPLAPGHCLVLSRRHVPWWKDLRAEESAALFAAARRVARRIEAAFAPELVCLYVRGRRVPHTHVFLVPSSRGDTLDRFFGELEVVQTSSPDLAALRAPAARREAAQRLRNAV
jgi:histidine triad (HIT) family protein